MTEKKKNVKLRKVFLVMQNKFIESAVGLGQCLKYGEYKTKTKINKGKDQRQKKKQII